MGWMGWMAPLRHLSAKLLCDRESAANREPSMGEITTIGLDLAKHVFQVHGVDAEGTTVVRKQLRRGQVLAFFSKLPRCMVGMEACATAHYWARELGALGHEVRLMPAQYVKAYVKRNKNDAADAEAICEAVVRPTMRFVPVKTAEQQAAVLLHRGRERLVRQRTMLANALRAHLAEFGVIAPQGLRNVGQLIAIMRPRFADTIRASSRFRLREQAGHMTASDLYAARQKISCQAGPSTHETMLN